MTTQAKPAESKVETREEKIEEILAILGELYQRFGTLPHSAAAGAAAPEYRYVGYRPYSTPELQTWVRGQMEPPQYGVPMTADYLRF